LSTVKLLGSFSTGSKALRVSHTSKQTNKTKKQ
jgi:hypothetical protein